MIVCSDADHSHTSETFYKCTSFTLGVYSIKWLKRMVHELRTDLNIILVRTTLNGAGKTPLGGQVGPCRMRFSLFSFWDLQVLLLSFFF